MATSWCCFLQQHDLLHYALWALISKVPPSIKPLWWNMILMPQYHVPLHLTHHPTQLKSILQIFSSPAGHLQSIAPHRNTCFQTRWKWNALGMSKAEVLYVFALQTSWAMWEENECHLLRLINKEHADVQLGRICFGGSNMLTLLNQADNGKFIWRQMTENRIWKWEGKSLGDKRLRIFCTLDQALVVLQHWII